MNRMNHKNDRLKGMRKMASCSGIILSGGLNTRMQGVNKAMLKIGGIPFLERLHAALKGVFSEILLVTKDTAAYRNLDLVVVKDLLDSYSPLSGIHAGLTNMRADYGFCVGCDTPLIKGAVVEMLVDAIGPRIDVVVPFSGVYYQPLCAVYAKRCAPLIESQLAGGDFKVDNLFAKVNVKTIPYEAFKRVDGELISFFNINTPPDLKLAEGLLLTS